eukprot:9723975-Ditylum_brightwellii.AAC.1
MGVNCQSTAWQLTPISDSIVSGTWVGFAVCYWVKIDPAAHSKLHTKQQKLRWRQQQEKHLSCCTSNSLQ